jgi:hypothetical protein
MEFKVPLSAFIDMCDILAKFVVRDVELPRRAYGPRSAWQRITLDQVSDIENFTVLRLNTFGGMRGAQLVRRREATAIPSMVTGAYKIAATDIAVTVVTVTEGTEWLSCNSGKQWLFPLQ